MSNMFTRNDKGPEVPAAPATPATSPTVPPPPAAQSSSEPPRRPLASAQPLASAGGQRGVSVISRALKITGQLESSEDIQIEGQVEGDVRAAMVRVGAGAKVHGTVSGEEVELSGTVDGKIEARKVVLTASAHMSGDIVHQDISIQSGAYVSGHLMPDYGKGESNVQPLKAKAE
jgi:cytoskeletal protein CcmA (bactofilin family)